MKAGRSRVALALLLVPGLLALTGCRDRVDLNDRAIVMAVGLDAADEPGRVEVSMAIAAPAGATGGGGAGNAGGGAGGAGGWRLIVRSSAGRTVEEATLGINPGIGRRVYTGSSALLAIGEDLARQGIRPWLDYFIRASDFPMKVWVVVTRGRARDLMAATSDESGFQVLDLQDAFEQVEPRQALTHNLRFWRFYDYLVAPHRDPWCAYVAALERNHLIEAVAVFSGDRLAGLLRDEEAAAFGLFLPGAFMSNVFVARPGPDAGEPGPGDSVAIRLKSVRKAVRVTSVAPRRLAINLRAEAIVTEGLPVTESPRAEAEIWQAKVTRAMEESVRRLVDRLRDWRADPLGFAETFRRIDPRLAEGWHDGWPDLEVDVTVELLFRTGLRGRGIGW